MKKEILFIGLFLSLACCGTISAQTTEFTYQGQLQNASAPANGSFDFEFLLFDAVSGGTQVGSTLTRTGVAVANGTFAVKLDFGGQFPGETRFLEIHVRQTGGGSFTPLIPRQMVNSAPYSVKSLNADNATNATNAVNATTATTAVNATNSSTANNALQLGGVDAGRFVQKDAGGNVSVTGALAVNGLIQSTSGGVRFPDGTTQISAATGGGSITGVTAGTGLTGGGTTGNVTVNIAPGGVGPTQLADNTVTTAKITDANVTNAKIADVAGGKITGSITTATVPGANVTGTVANATNAGNAVTATTAATATNATNATNATTAATAVNFSGALAGDVSGNQSTTTVEKLRNLPLPAPVLADNGKVLSYKNDGVNTPTFELTTVTGGSGGTLTGVTPGTGLSGGGTSGTVTVGIAPGGVGATELATNAVTTAKLADGNVTTAKLADANVTNAKIADVAGGKITGSITTATIPGANVTGVVAAANGGTGLNAAGTLGNFLRSNGTSWASSAIQATDVPNLDASKVTTGTFGTAHIPDLSASYIRNQTAVQSVSNFNISGSGTAAGTLSGNIVSSTTQYNIGGNAVLRAPGSNIFAGVNTAGTTLSNVFNSVFGGSAGNPFMGTANSFFGHQAGSFGSGNRNSFFGRDAGSSVGAGNDNTFVGNRADFVNNTFQGNKNTLLGSNAQVESSTNNATAIGADALVQQSNSLVLGSINGINLATANTNVGIGTTQPATRLHVVGNVGVIGSIGIGTTSPAEALDISVNSGHILLGNAGCNLGFNGIGFGTTLAGCTNFSMLGNGTDTTINRPTGGAISFRENNVTQMSIAAGGVVRILNLAAATATTLCRTANNDIAACTSARKYKSNINSFSSGLDLIKRLRPVSFNWITDHALDFGLVAEEVEKVEPLLVTYDQKGEVEGVKYDRVGVVLVNAVKEQQTQIEALQKQIKAQRAEIDAFKSLVCSQNPTAEICRPKN